MKLDPVEGIQAQIDIARATKQEGKIDEIVRLTLESKPEGETHWSCRTMARATGVSPATVQRVWSAREMRDTRYEVRDLGYGPGATDKRLSRIAHHASRIPRRFG